MIDETAASMPRPTPAEVPEWGHEGADPVFRVALSTAGSVLRTARAYAGLSQRELAPRPAGTS